MRHWSVDWGVPLSTLTAFPCHIALTPPSFSPRNPSENALDPYTCKTRMYGSRKQALWNEELYKSIHCLKHLYAVTRWLNILPTWSWVFKRSMGAVTVLDTASASPAARTNLLHIPESGPSSGNSKGIARLSPTSNTYKHETLNSVSSYSYTVTYV